MWGEIFETNTCVRTDITTQMDPFFPCSSALPWCDLPAGRSQDPVYSLSFWGCTSEVMVIMICAQGHLPLQIGFCRLVTELLFSSSLHVLSLSPLSVAVHYADLPFHVGLAGSHGLHLPASLHVLQSVDHLPKHHLSGGSQPLPGPASVW